MSRIFTDKNGLVVNALSGLIENNPFINPLVDAEGHVYTVHTEKGISQIVHQMGPVPANGVNGLTTEAVLAMEIHRIKYLNDKFPCGENEAAINYMTAALNVLNERTAKREARGVEGQNVV